MPGIYEIKCLKNNKCYIGESVNCLNRLGRHIDALENNRHDCIELQTDFNCYGKKGFSIKVLKKGLCYKNDLTRKKIEKKILLTRNNIYNSFSKLGWTQYSQQIKVEGKIYHSLRSAALILKQSKTNLIRKCRDQNNLNYQYLEKVPYTKCCQPVQIDGIYYPSIKAATLKLKLAFSTVKKRCQSEQYPTYIFF